MTRPTFETRNVVDEVTRVLQMEGEAILRCGERLKNPAASGAIRKALTLMQDSLTAGGKIVVTGVGKSGKVGQKIAATLCSTGSLAIFLHPTEGLHGDLGVLAKNDVVLLFSYTGNTDELVRLLPSIRGMGVPVIGVGGNALDPRSRSSAMPGSMDTSNRKLARTISLRHRARRSRSR